MSRDSPTPEPGFDPLDPSQVHPDDIPDPHLAGVHLHALAHAQISSFAVSLIRLLRQVAAPA